MELRVGGDGFMYMCEGGDRAWTAAFSDLSIGYNLGAEWDGTLPGATTFAAFCLGFSASERLGCLVESYNYFNKLGNAYCMDFGLNWMAGRKVQLDISANIDLRNPAQCWTVSCGAAWQINLFLTYECKNSKV